MNCPYVRHTFRSKAGSVSFTCWTSLPQVNIFTWQALSLARARGKAMNCTLLGTRTGFSRVSWTL